MQPESEVVEAHYALQYFTVANSKTISKIICFLQVERITEVHWSESKERGAVIASFLSENWISFNLAN